MEVPPGRVERIADGGPEAIRSILAELRAMKFNGVLKTSVFRGDRRPGRGARAGDRPGGPRARDVREGAGGPSQPRANARRTRRGAVPPEVGTRAGVPTKRDATAGTGLPPGGTADRQGGERTDPEPPRRATRVPRRGGRVPEEGPRDGIREGAGGGRGPAAEPLGATGQTRGAGARVRIEGSYLSRPRDVARCASRVPRARAETDERSVRQPASGGREDLRGPEGLRRPPRGGGTPGAAPHEPGAGNPRTGAEAPGPRCGGLSAGTHPRGPGEIVPEKYGRPGGPRGGARREERETRQTGRGVRGAGRGTRRPAGGTRTGDEAHAEAREGPRREGP